MASLMFESSANGSMSQARSQDRGYGNRTRDDTLKLCSKYSMSIVHGTGPMHTIAHSFELKCYLQYQVFLIRP